MCGACWLKRERKPVDEHIEKGSQEKVTDEVDHHYHHHHCCHHQRHRHRDDQAEEGECI